MNKVTRLLLWLAGWVFFLLVLSLGLTALAVRHSRQQLEEYKESLEKRGELFDAVQLAPPAPPAEGNLAREFVGIAKELGNEVGSQKIQLFQMSKEKSPGVNEIIHQRPFAIVSTKEVPWDEVNSKLVPLATLLAGIREISGSPIFEIQPDYSKGFSMPLAGATESLKAAQFLAQEGILLLQQDMPSAAVGNVHSILQLAGMTQKQNVLISQLVSASQIGLAQIITWEILQNPKTTKSELNILQQDWNAIRLSSSMVPVWRMERAMGLSFFETPSLPLFSALTPAPAMAAVPFKGAFATLPKSVDEFFAMGAFFIWSTVYRHADAREYMQIFQTLIDDAPRDPLTGPWFPVLEKGRQIQGRLQHAGIRRLFSRVVFESLEGSFTRILLTQASANLTRTAIALQRYQLDHNQYPQSLAELVPAYLDAIPTDLFDGKPLRYRLESGGQYVLWTTGSDGEDNGGDVATKPGGKRKNFFDGRDLVWPRAAK